MRTSTTAQTSSGIAKKRPLMKSPPTEIVYSTYNSAETAAAISGSRRALKRNDRQ